VIARIEAFRPLWLARGSQTHDECGVPERAAEEEAAVPRGSAGSRGKRVALIRLDRSGPLHVELSIELRQAEATLPERAHE
jgi:hypothetical protein